MPSLPSGTVTFLFTDIEGSTSLWEQHPQAAATALARHHEIVREAIGVHIGLISKSSANRCGKKCSLHKCCAAIYT